MAGGVTVFSLKAKLRQWPKGITGNSGARSPRPFSEVSRSRLATPGEVKGQRPSGGPCVTFPEALDLANLCGLE